MPLRWKTSRLLGSRRANAATNRQSAANRALISRLLGVNQPFIGCEGARQRFTQVAEPFADTFLLGDVTATRTRGCRASCRWRATTRSRTAPTGPGTGSFFACRSRSRIAPASEVVLGCEILINRMTALGRSASYRIGR